MSKHRSKHLRNQVKKRRVIEIAQTAINCLAIISRFDTTEFNQLPIHEGNRATTKQISNWRQKKSNSKYSASNPSNFQF